MPTRTSAILLFLLVSAANLALPAADAQAPSVLILVTDAWRKPIQGAKIFAGSAPTTSSEPLAISAEDGRCTIKPEAGLMLTVDHNLYAPRVMSLEQSDIDRGYVTATLYEGGSVHGTFYVGSRPIVTDYVLLRYADPTIYSGYFQVQSQRNGSFRFSHVPEGLAYVTAGIRNGGVARTTTVTAEVANESTNYLQLSLRAGSSGLRGNVTDHDGAAVKAILSGSLAYSGREFEEIQVETSEAGIYNLEELPAGTLALRATLPDGSFKRIEVEIPDAASVERSIDFAEGVILRCALENPPAGASIDVFLLDGRMNSSRGQSATDRARYIRGARAGVLGAGSSPIEIPGIVPGEYTALALARVDGAGRPHVEATAFQPLTIGAVPAEVVLTFQSSE